MCGIAGFLTQDGFSEAETEVLVSMTRTLAHRGPDDEGYWVDAHAGIGLGHRRLSVIDLSSDGHQPMESACGRYAMVYNGEIYNFRDLKVELEAAGQRFRGHSDTEVLLSAISRWGLEETLRRVNGMFAIALWDRNERTLILVRDRFGEKPLYYGWFGNIFVFASELRALRQHPAFQDDVDRDALALFVRHGHVPGGGSIYRGIHKLPPGNIMALRADAMTDSLPRPYWSISSVVAHGAEHRVSSTPEETVSTLDSLLQDAVRLRMEADVPLGAFLSGGIDSSLIVALMQSQSSQPVRTFTIGFREREYDEAAAARAVARYLGTDHVEMYVTPQEALDIIPRLPEIYDEPFADPSEIPTAILAGFTRNNVTVALSGDGGDELFGGYTRHTWAKRVLRAASVLPIPVQRVFSKTLSRMSSGWEDAVFCRLFGSDPDKLGQRNLPEKLQKLAQSLPIGSVEELYEHLTSGWRANERVVLGTRSPSETPALPQEMTSLDVTEQMMYLDSTIYLPDDILVKVDRATMDSGLEARVPFLDERVFELAWRLPVDFKIHQGMGKWMLRRILYEYVPPSIVDRPKMGFNVPIGRWLRGPLLQWAEELLDERRVRCEGYFDPAPIRQRWQEHKMGNRNWQAHLWPILMFQSWLEHHHR